MMPNRVVQAMICANVPRPGGLHMTIVREGWVLPSPSEALTLWEVAASMRAAGAPAVFVTRVLPDRGRLGGAMS